MRGFLSGWLRGGHLRAFSTEQYMQPLFSGQYAPRHRTTSITTGSLDQARSRIGIVRPKDIVEDAKVDWYNESAQLTSGAKLRTLPILGNILGPFRDGELTIFTGPTGTGKTTVLSQISLDYAAQDIGTLWGSFEVKNARLVRIMLQQISDPPLSIDSYSGKWNGETLKRLDDACCSFSHLPLAFLDAHGSIPTQELLDAMHNAIQLKDQSGNRTIRHIILDNLQFMLANQHHTSLDKYDIADRALHTLRNFATQTNTHVTLVIHPRKELDDTFLGLSSVSGTAKATQEADNVIILQKVNSRRYLDVRKNRFSGDLGKVEIEYNPETRLVRELSNGERHKGEPINRENTQERANDQVE